MASATTDAMTDLQKDVFTKITNNDLEGLKTLFASNKMKVDFTDENGMSPLQHACYKGNKEIVQLLLDQGADVNICRHEHKYTALHFAALSGNAELCSLLMSHGARITATNSVGRTPAQMAAFVGNHNCVATINNFIPKADIDYYIKPQGTQTEPMLPPYLADSFHKFIMQVNVNPVRVIMNLIKYPGLLENIQKVQKVLESLRQKEMSRGGDTNEVMAFKYHYLSFVVQEVIKCQRRKEAQKAKLADSKKEETNQKESDDKQVKNEDKKEENDKDKKEISKENIDENDKDKKEKKEDTVDDRKCEAAEFLIRTFLKGNKNVVLGKSTKMTYEDAFLREAVREFPFRESVIFRQMVATLASSDPPSALSVVSAAINGQKGFNDNVQICVTCGEEKAAKKCSKCKEVQYCDRECQRLHWVVHKKECVERNRTKLSQSPANNAKMTDADKEQLSKCLTQSD